MSAELAQKRLDNLKKFADAHNNHSDAIDSAVGLGHCEFDGTANDAPFDRRYLLLLMVRYTSGDDAPELDHCETESADDLDGVKAHLEGHVFEETREGYSHDAVVVDLDTGLEVKWEKKEEVVLKDAPKDDLARLLELAEEMLDSGSDEGCEDAVVVDAGKFFALQRLATKLLGRPCGLPEPA